jgi:ankyrin repeat protein
MIEKGRLFDACKAGDIDLITQQNGVNVRLRNSEGDELIHIAALNGHIDIVEHLLRNGVPVDVKSKTGFTSLLYACQGGHIDVAKLLVDKEAELQATTPEFYLMIHLATCNGCIELADYLVEHVGMDQIILHWACSQGNVDVVKFLVGKGVAKRFKDSDGDEPIHVAAWTGRADVVRYLLEQGVPVDAKGRNDWTSLHYSCQLGRADVANILMKNAADVEVIVQGGNRPIHIAAGVFSMEVQSFRYLFPSHNGSTGAVSHLDVARSLMKNRADLRKKNLEKETALDIARRSSRSELVEYLEGNTGDSTVISQNVYNVKLTTLYS